AAFGGGAVKAPAGNVVGQGAVVEERVVAAQRQGEAVPALGGPVAGAGVAAHARDHGHHVADETDLVFLFLPAHLYRHLNRLTGKGNLELAVAVGHGTNDPPRRDLDDLGRHLDLHQPRDIDLIAVVEVAGEEQLRVRVGGLQGDRRGGRLDLDELGAG